MQSCLAGNRASCQLLVEAQQCQQCFNNLPASGLPLARHREHLS